MSQPFRFHLSVYASSEPDEQPTNLDWPPTETQPDREHWLPEANLSTPSLAKPMFLVHQLKPNTNYAVQVSLLDVAKPVERFMVQFTTSFGGALATGGPLEPIAVETSQVEGQPAALLSVLTRASPSAGPSSARANSKRAPSQIGSFSLSDWLLGAWQDLFQSGQQSKSASSLDVSAVAPVHRPGNPPRARQQQQLRSSSELISLTDPSTLGLLASLLLLTLLGLMALALISRRRKRQVHMQRPARPLECRSEAAKLASVKLTKLRDADDAHEQHMDHSRIHDELRWTKANQEQDEPGGFEEQDDLEPEDEDKHDEPDTETVRRGAPEALVGAAHLQTSGRRLSNGAQVTLERQRSGCARVSKSRSTLCFQALDTSTDWARLSPKESTEARWRASLGRAIVVDTKPDQAGADGGAAEQALIRDAGFNSLERRQTSTPNRSLFSRSSQAGQLILDYASAGRACPASMFQCLLVNNGPLTPTDGSQSKRPAPGSVQTAADLWAQMGDRRPADGSDRSHQFMATHSTASMAGLSPQTGPTTMSDSSSELEPTRLPQIDCPSIAPDRFDPGLMQYIELLPADYALVHHCPSPLGNPNQAPLVQAAVWANLQAQPNTLANHLVSEQTSSHSSLPSSRLTACNPDHHNYPQHLCPSIASPSSANSNKDPFISSPLSLTNTTISNAESFTINNRDNHEPSAFSNLTSLDQHTLAETQIRMLELNQFEPKSDKTKQIQLVSCDDNQISTNTNFAHSKTNTQPYKRNHSYQYHLTSILKNSNLTRSQHMGNNYDLGCTDDPDRRHSTYHCNGVCPSSCISNGTVNSDDLDAGHGDKLI